MKGSMRKQELEFKILECVESVQKGNLVEDQTTELKAVFPETERKAARQLAGHANAARSEEIT